MALLGRIVIIIIAVIVANFAAGIVIAMGLLGPQWHGLTGDVAERGVFTVMVFVGAIFTGAVGLLPLAVLIGIAEAFKIRSLLIYAVAGVALLLLGYSSSGFAPSYEESIDHPPPPVSHATEVAAAAGAAFGLTYWLLAGRNAGRWRERGQPSA